MKKIYGIKRCKKKRLVLCKWVTLDPNKIIKHNDDNITLIIVKTKEIKVDVDLK